VQKADIKFEAVRLCSAHKQKLDGVRAHGMHPSRLLRRISLKSGGFLSLAHSWHISNENFAPAREVGCARERVRGGCIGIERRRRRKSFRCGSLGQRQGAHSARECISTGAARVTSLGGNGGGGAAPTSSQPALSVTRARGRGLSPGVARMSPAAGQWGRGDTGGCA